MRTLIFTCDISILETLLDDKHINLTLGAFECNYLIPDDFDIDAYYNLHNDLHMLDYEQLVDHWLKWGKYEMKSYKY